MKLKEKAERVSSNIPAIKAQGIQFTQEGEHIVFICKDGEGWNFGAQEFEGCCDYEATSNVVIVRTQSLQEMGYTF